MLAEVKGPGLLVASALVFLPLFTNLLEWKNSRKLEHKKSRNPQFRLSGQALGLYGLLIQLADYFCGAGQSLGAGGF